MLSNILLYSGICRSYVSSLSHYTPGQDVLSGGFMGAMFGGLLCGAQILNRNLYNDLLELKKKIAKSK